MVLLQNPNGLASATKADSTTIILTKLAMFSFITSVANAFVIIVNEAQTGTVVSADLRWFHFIAKLTDVRPYVDRTGIDN